MHHGAQEKGDLGQVESGGHRDTAGTSKIIGQDGLNRLLMWEERPGRKALDLQTMTKSDKFNLFSLIPRHDLGTSNGGESPKAVYEGFNLIAQRAGIKSGDIVDAPSCKE